MTEIQIPLSARADYVSEMSKNPFSTGEYYYIFPSITETLEFFPLAASFFLP